MEFESSPTRRRRQERATPTGDSQYSELNRYARMWYLCNLNLKDANSSVNIGELIKKVQQVDNPDDPVFNDAYDLVSRWNRVWKHESIKAFKAHIVDLITANPDIVNMIPEARLKDWSRKYFRIELMADLLPFTGKFVNFQDSTIIDPEDSEEVKERKRLLLTWLVNIYVWICEELFKLHINPRATAEESKKPQVMWKILHKSFPPNAILPEHWALKPQRPMKARVSTAQEEVTATSINPSFTVVSIDM